MAFTYRTIQRSDKFQPFEYQTILVFRSPLNNLFRKLRKYVGPSSPSPDPRETKEWVYLSEKIRLSADVVYTKIQVRGRFNYSWGWNTEHDWCYSGSPLFGFPMVLGFPMAFCFEQNGGHLSKTIPLEIRTSETFSIPIISVQAPL